MYHYFLLNNIGPCTTAQVSLESVQQLGGGMEGEGGEGRKGREGGLEGRQIGDKGLSIIRCSKYIDKFVGQTMRGVQKLCEKLLQKSVIG